MIALKKILVPVDFSESSDKAILYGISFGRQYKAKVVLLFVIDDRIFEEVAFFDETTYVGYAEHEIRENRRKGFQERINRIVEKMQGEDDKLEIEGKISFGIPCEEIDKFAREKEIGMIVMGSHGNTGIKHFLLGSITEKVIRKAPCPVLVVRSLEREFIDES